MNARVPDLNRRQFIVGSSAITSGLAIGLTFPVSLPQVQAAAASAGLTIHHERIAVFPNTWRAHRLLSFSEQQHPEQHEALLDALFEAYFVQGLDIGDSQVLAQLAQAHGIDGREADAFDAPPVWALPGGASGVPLFVFNQREAISGAQPPEVLLAALLAAENVS